MNPAAQLSSLIDYSQSAFIFVAYFFIGMVLCAAWWRMHEVMPSLAKAILAFAIMFANAFILLPVMTPDAPTPSPAFIAMFFGGPFGFLFTACALWLGTRQEAKTRKNTNNLPN